MVLHKLERRNYGGKSLVSIKYQNLHSFKEGLILLCQSILEMRRITHLHGSVHFTIPLKYLFEADDHIQDIPSSLFVCGYKYVSFDAESLFTNVPIKKTILYSHEYIMTVL